QRLPDWAIPTASSALLDEQVLGDAVDRACSRLTANVEKHRAQMISVERELAGIQLRIERLLDALADGSLPRDEVAGRLNAEKSRKDTDGRARPPVERAPCHRRRRHQDQGRALGQGPGRKGVARSPYPSGAADAPEAPRRQDRARACGHGRDRGYKFRGALTVDRLIAGDTLAKAELNNTSDG